MRSGCCGSVAMAAVQGDGIPWNNGGLYNGAKSTTAPLPCLAGSCCLFLEPKRPRATSNVCDPRGDSTLLPQRIELGRAIHAAYTCEKRGLHGIPNHIPRGQDVVDQKQFKLHGYERATWTRSVQYLAPILLMRRKQKATIPVQGCGRQANGY